MVGESQIRRALENGQASKQVVDELLKYRDVLPHLESFEELMEENPDLFARSKVKPKEKAD